MAEKKVKKEKKEKIPKQRFILEEGTDGAQDVYDTQPRRKVGWIKLVGPGNQHSAYDAEGNHLGDFDGGGAAKDAVKYNAKKGER